MVSDPIFLPWLEAAASDPFTGIGKPEPLRGDLSGFWSRRIDDANRLVYEATDGNLCHRVPLSPWVELKQGKLAGH